MVEIERERNVVDVSAVSDLVKRNANLLMPSTDNKGCIDTGEHSPEELIRPSFDYLLSLYRPEDREPMRKSLRRRLINQQLRSIFEEIFSEWHTNVP